MGRNGKIKIKLINTEKQKKIKIKLKEKYFVFNNMLFVLTQKYFVFVMMMMMMNLMYFPMMYPKNPNCPKTVTTNNCNSKNCNVNFRQTLLMHHSHHSS